MTPFDEGLLDPSTALSGVADDASFLAAMVDVEAAHLGAVAAIGGTTGAAHWDPADLDLAALASAAAAGGNPVIPLVTELRKRTPTDLADSVHLGLTSQDVIDSALMLLAARTIRRVAPEVQQIARALAGLADEHRHTSVAGRTLGQQAAPSTVGLRLAVVLDGVVRTWQDLAGIETPLQLGGSVGTLAVLVDRFGVDRTEALRLDVAARLGLTARMGVWQVERSPVVRLAAALAAFIGALGRFGLEVAQGARSELGELELVLGTGEGGSSAMPHKQNPVPAVLLVANARRAPGLVATLLASQLALDDRPAGDWHAEWQPFRELLRLASESAVQAARAVSALHVDAARAMEHLEASGGALHAERAHQVLAGRLGRARAAELVGAALATDDFVSAIRSAAAQDPAVDEETLRGLERATQVAGPVGLSDRLIDAVLAASRTERG